MKAIAFYKANRHEELLTFVEARLRNEPEQSDVVHDLLAYLADKMIEFNKQRQEAVEDFMLGLEGVLSDSELRKIDRLWTPMSPIRADDVEAEARQVQAREILGSLAEQQLDVRDDIGLLNEEQWKWLLKRRLSKPNLVDLTKMFRRFQPAIAEIDKRIRDTDYVIDQIVYRLYGLTQEEIGVVEGHN